jgi:hypothetical protein
MPRYSFQKFQVYNSLLNVLCLSFMQQISGYSSTLQFRLSIYVSFGNIIRCYGDTRVRNSLKIAYLFVLLEKMYGDPQFLFLHYFTITYTNNEQNIEMFCYASFWKTQKCRSLIQSFCFGITKFFIFGKLKNFCNTMQCAKFQHRSPNEITRYNSLFKISISNDASNWHAMRYEHVQWCDLAWASSHVRSYM